MTTESATAELTSVQLAHFDSFGFVVRCSLFTPAEMEQTSRDYDDVMDGTLVPEAGQATYSRNPIEEALADLPVYGER